MAMKELVLTVSDKWFSLIKSGAKKEEYREINGYNDNLFDKYFYDKGNLKSCYVVFKNGYDKKSQRIICLCNLSQGYGKKEWGAIPNKYYFILEILEVKELKYDKASTINK